MATKQQKEHWFLGTVVRCWRGKAWAGESTAGKRKRAKCVGGKGEGGQWREIQKERERERNDGRNPGLNLWVLDNPELGPLRPCQLPTHRGSPVPSPNPNPDLAHAGSLHDTQADSTWSVQGTSQTHSIHKNIFIYHSGYNRKWIRNMIEKGPCYISYKQSHWVSVCSWIQLTH